MRLIIVSGLSGSGKSVALHLLEDIDFYCVDNIPAALLKPFISHTIRGTDDVYPRTAVGLDARNRPNEIETIPALVAELRRSGISCEVLFLHASDEVLLKRYAETRRKHPLVSGGPGRGHLQYGGPRPARAGARAHRPPARGAAVPDVRVVRLQARHTGR